MLWVSRCLNLYLNFEFLYWDVSSKCFFFFYNHCFVQVILLFIVYVPFPNLRISLYLFFYLCQVMLLVRENQFWIVVLANFMQQRFEVFCTYYDTTEAESISRIVIDNFKKAYTARYNIHRYNINKFQLLPAQIVSDNVNEWVIQEFNIHQYFSLLCFKNIVSCLFFWNLIQEWL